MNLIYDENKCIGCGACKLAYPAVWNMATVNGKAELLDSTFKKGKYYLNLFSDDLPLAEACKKACSVKAISIQ